MARMGWADLIGRAAGGPVAFTLPDPPVEPAPRPGGYPDGITRAIAEAKASMWIAGEAESIPGVRRALAVIVGTISALTLAGWKGDRRLPLADYPWLAQPDPATTSQAIMAATVRDGIWHDRAFWRKVPGGYRRIRPDRVTPDPTTLEDGPARWLVDGRAISADDVVAFDFAGAGGLKRFGLPLLDMFCKLLAAAGRYADEPVPSVILKNTGIDVPDTEVDAIIARWEEARATRRTGYLNAYLEASTPGYNARDLQLVEVMDQATKDVARLFGLPGWALGVDEGSSMTYANVTDRRRDLLEALRPWSTTIEQTLSLTTYAVSITGAGATAARRGLYVPYGTAVRFDTTDYLREPFGPRTTALVAASGGPIMSTLEARILEPTITDPGDMSGLSEAGSDARAPAPPPA